jgi:hypothetical protein
LSEGFEARLCKKLGALVCEGIGAKFDEGRRARFGDRSLGKRA